MLISAAGIIAQLELLVELKDEAEDWDDNRDHRLMEAIKAGVRNLARLSRLAPIALHRRLPGSRRNNLRVKVLLKRRKAGLRPASPSLKTCPAAVQRAGRPSGIRRPGCWSSETT
jgi:hypothetical protein